MLTGAENISRSIPCGYRALNSNQWVHYTLSPNVQQKNGELTGEWVLAVIEAMAVLVSLICRLKSCFSCRPRWLDTWSNRTKPSSCFWKRETRTNINSSQKSEYLMEASLYSRWKYVAQCLIYRKFKFLCFKNQCSSSEWPIIHIQYPGGVRFWKHNLQHNCSFTKLVLCITLRENM